MGIIYSPETKHTLAREAVDREIAHARTGRNHPSVRVVTLERVLAITDAKTEALKAIHRICNRILYDPDLSDVDIVPLTKQMREIASATWPAIAPCRQQTEPKQ
jgi:hypothetical protein